MKAKFYALVAMTLSGATLFHSCLGGLGGGGGGGLNGFWQGFWNTGWPTDNRWLNIGIDVLKEELFG